MTMLELSAAYRDSAAALWERIRELRAAKRQATDPEEIRALQARISALAPILRETRELALFTAHYYDRRYERNAKYRL